MDKTDALRVLRSISPGSSITAPVRNLQHGSEVGKRLLTVSYKYADLSHRIRYLSCPDPRKQYIRIWRIN